jgi:hypothetical protein
MAPDVMFTLTVAKFGNFKSLMDTYTHTHTHIHTHTHKQMAC